MIRRAFIPLTFVAAGLLLGGCATTRNVAGEPSPKAEGEAPAEAAPAEGAAQAPTGQATAAAPKPATPQFIPTGKPQIVGRFEIVQFPAWVERAGIRAGIKPGWAVYSSDRVITGGEGRVEITTAGDGRLSMSGDANVEFTQAYEFTGGGVEPSLFRLNRGTIQFVAPMVRTATAPGTLIEVADGINATVLGGQLIARADSNEALIALGDATVVRVAGSKLNPGTMREPNTYLRVPRAGKAQAVATASGTDIARWVSSTRTVSSRPALSADGLWDVSLNSGYNLRQLENMACNIQRRGFSTEIYPVKEAGKLTWYRVVVRRFASKNDAVNFLGTAKALGSKEPWVLVPQS